MIADIINTEEDEMLGEYQEDFFKKLSPRTEDNSDHPEIRKGSENA